MWGLESDAVGLSPGSATYWLCGHNLHEPQFPHPSDGHIDAADLPPAAVGTESDSEGENRGWAS